MEDCYFFIDADRPIEEHKIETLCCACRSEHYPDVGWFWSKEDGFGPWTYKCKLCHKVIHQKEDNGEAKTTD